MGSRETQSPYSKLSQSMRSWNPNINLGIFEIAVADIQKQFYLKQISSCGGLDAGRGRGRRHKRGEILVLEVDMLVLKDILEVEGEGEPVRYIWENKKSKAVCLPCSCVFPVMSNDIYNVLLSEFLLSL